MNWRKHKLLLTSAIIFALLLGGALYLLLTLRGGYVEQKKNLQSKAGQLSNLNNRNPFPSKENLQGIQENADSLENFHQDLIKSLSAGQVEPLKIESAQFPTLLNRTAIRIRGKARTHNVSIPENFLFGFERYADGSLPAPANVERLTLQLQMAEELIDVLYNAGVKSIVSVERIIFEDITPLGETSRGNIRGAPRRTSRQPAPEETSDQYSKEPFTISYASTDPSNWDVLNKLASHPMFIVTTEVELSNTAVPDASLAPLYKGTDPQNRTASVRNRENTARMPPSAVNPFARSQPVAIIPNVAEAEKPKGPIASHEERIVAGRELVEAVVKVNIYRITRPLNLNSEEGASDE